MSVRPLNPELAEKARLELNEDPKRLVADLQHLKDWIDKQPHLNARKDDQWLVAFLRGCKFSLERAKEKLDLYYTLRRTAPDLCNVNHRDPRFKEILRMGAYVVLPKPAGPAGTLIAIIRPGVYDPNKYHITEILSASAILTKIILIEFDNASVGRSRVYFTTAIVFPNIILMEFDNAVVAGTESILDLENVTMGHFFQMTPVTMKKMVLTGQDALPVRMKGSHYLNTPPGFETIFNAIKSLLNEKNKQRLYVHNKNITEMYKYIPQETLPHEYGGEAGTIHDITSYWEKKVEEYGEWLDEDMKYISDESKRLGKPKTAEEMFGVEGSFRQLEFD